MHTQTVFELSQEAERLLHLALHHLEALQSVPFAALQQDSSGASELPLHFSQQGIEAQQETLRSELRKITRQEMVLAIVGTMKAGKSTTINAIIGTEVLPNRNRPMTALPTFIRHTPGQKEPVLHFPHVAPIEALMGELQQQLRHFPRELLSRHLELDQDMVALLLRIEHGTHFEKHYLGAQPIFHCLKSLNDLVRLSKVLGVAFPFSAYAAIEHVPFIDVEFVHLAGLEGGHGQLTLLDTPGPNEAGQPHLQQMLSEQLGRASAVLAVMDYTQLKSVSDEEVRRAISAVGNGVPLYALVNKFDQKDRNSDDADQVRALISGTLMKGDIDPEHIFPVSSMWGYLANRARHELAQHGALPDPAQQRWVQDFAEAALGRRWRDDDLADIPRIRQAADLLWEDSLFEQPVTTILHAAHASASLYALRSASHKLLNYARSTGDYLAFRCQGLNVASEGLQDNITRLEQDRAVLAASRKGVEDEIQHEVIRTLETVAACINSLQTRLVQDVEFYFSEGMLPQHERYDALAIPQARRRDFIPYSSRLTMENEEDARMMMQTLRAACELMLHRGQERLSRELAGLFPALESNLSRTLHDALAPVQQRVTDGLLDAGFRTRIALPAFQTAALNLDVQQLFINAVAPQDVPVATLRRAAGMRGTMARWLNSSDWGWEDAVATRTHYFIDLDNLKQSLLAHISQFSNQLNQAVATQINSSVSLGLATFFSDFTRVLSDIDASLRQSLAARQQSEEQLMALEQQLQRCTAATAWLHEDTRMLRDDIQTLFAVQTS